jgi:hypothetical protein
MAFRLSRGRTPTPPRKTAQACSNAAASQSPLLPREPLRDASLWVVSMGLDWAIAPSVMRL